MPPGIPLAIAVLAVTFSQCAGGPALARKVEVREGSRALISLRQATVNLTLINRSALTKAQAKTARQDDLSLKLIPDNQVQLLLDMLGAEGFFELASGVADDEARSWLTVVADGRSYILSGRAARGDHAYMQRFANCINLFSNVYSSNDSFSGSKMTTQDLKRASQATRADSDAIRRKKGNSKQP